MALVTPDRTKDVRGITLYIIERGKPGAFLVSADALREDATIAHLVDFESENEKITALPVTEWFVAIEEAIAAYPILEEEWKDEIEEMKKRRKRGWRSRNA